MDILEKLNPWVVWGSLASCPLFCCREEIEDKEMSDNEERDWERRNRCHSSVFFGNWLRMIFFHYLHGQNCWNAPKFMSFIGNIVKNKSSRELFILPICLKLVGKIFFFGMAAGRKDFFFPLSLIAVAPTKWWKMAFILVILYFPFFFLSAELCLLERSSREVIASASLVWHIWWMNCDKPTKMTIKANVNAYGVAKCREDV